MKALIVDDSMVTRNIIKKYIVSMGFDALEAGNGKLALDLLEKQAHEVGLILLDWNMPVLNGFETLKSVKEKEAYKHICVIMISTESEDDMIDEALAAGASGYLAKPFTEEEFIKKIGKSLDGFRSAKP
jgi:two-component system chemotaxis response regulator CheY